MGSHVHFSIQEKELPLVIEYRKFIVVFGEYDSFSRENYLTEHFFQVLFPELQILEILQDSK